MSPERLKALNLCAQRKRDYIEPTFRSKTMPGKARGCFSSSEVSGPEIVIKKGTNAYEDCE